MSACATTGGRSWMAAVALAGDLIHAADLAAQQRRTELADLGREVELATPRLSPDGRQVVLVRSRSNYRDNRFEWSLVLVDDAMEPALGASAHPTRLRVRRHASLTDR